MVAARGVVAARVIRACADLGFASVAVYDDADIWAPHARLADEAYALPAGAGYGDAGALTAVALRARADAVHLGDGRLTAGDAAARTGGGPGLRWISGGSPPAGAGRSLARTGKRPLPRAANGQLRAQVDLLAGTAGTLIVGTRFTALSRRGDQVAAHSAPPDAAAELARRTRTVVAERGITGYGVARFEQFPDRDWQLLGVSARLTAGHAVVEEQSGVDIVAAQLALAFDAGAALPRPGRERWAFGFAVEAEDRARGGLRAGGVVSSLTWPSGPGVRVDPGAAPGQVIVPERDNRLAFVTVSGSTPLEARQRLARAAAEVAVSGVTMSAWLPGAAGLPDPAFSDVAPDTGLVELEVRGGGATLRVAR